MLLYNGIYILRSYDYSNLTYNVLWNYKILVRDVYHWLVNFVVTMYNAYKSGDREFFLKKEILNLRNQRVWK